MCELYVLIFTILKIKMENLKMFNYYYKITIINPLPISVTIVLVMRNYYIFHKK